MHTNTHQHEAVWQAMIEADVFTEGEFVFASGETATLKVEAEKLYDHPKQLAVVLGAFVTHPVVEEADVLLYVPDGWRRFTELLGLELDKPVVQSQRKPGTLSRYEFAFSSEQDRELAQSATNPCIAEDVVTTLGSVAGMRQLLLPDQIVHSLAMLKRSPIVLSEYQVGLDDNYLLERVIPHDKDEFKLLYDL